MSINNHQSPGSLPPLPVRLALDVLRLLLELLEPSRQSRLGRLRAPDLLGGGTVVVLVVALFLHSLGRVDQNLPRLLFLFPLPDVIANALGFDDADARAGQDVQVQPAGLAV